MHNSVICCGAGGSCYVADCGRRGFRCLWHHSGAHTASFGKVFVVVRRLFVHSLHHAAVAQISRTVTVFHEVRRLTIVHGQLHAHTHHAGSCANANKISAESKFKIMILCLYIVCEHIQKSFNYHLAVWIILESLKIWIVLHTLENNLYASLGAHCTAWSGYSFLSDKADSRQCHTADWNKILPLSTVLCVPNNLYNLVFNVWIPRNNSSVDYYISDDGAYVLNRVILTPGRKSQCGKKLLVSYNYLDTTKNMNATYIV